MDGVEILATEQVALESISNEVAVWIVFGITFLISICAGLWASYRKQKELISVHMALGFLIALMFAGVTAIITARPVGYETHYIVAVSNEVRLNEFNEKYEIIDQNGEIYTVREKE